MPPQLPFGRMVVAFVLLGAQGCLIRADTTVSSSTDGGGKSETPVIPAPSDASSAPDLADSIAPRDLGSVATVDAGSGAPDLQVDPMNCGALGYACNPRMACIKGACEHVVFATSFKYDGNLAGLIGADAKCQLLAQLAGLRHPFKAWLSNATTGPDTRFEHSPAPYRLAGPVGELISASWNALVAQAPNAPDITNKPGDINRTEDGTFLPGFEYVWTGTYFDGRPTELVLQSAFGAGHDTCKGWTSAAFDGSAAVLGLGGSLRAQADAPKYAWSWGGSNPCSVEQRLFCFEQR